MKYMQRAEIYKNYNGNCTFDPKSLEARSYNWWSMVRKIGQLTVFNSYRYSVTTAKHQRDTRSLMRDLGIQIHADIEAPGGLQNLGSAIELYSARIDALKALIKKPGTRVVKNAERAGQIKELQAKIKQVKALQRMAK